MIFIVNPYFDPYFNISCEEFLLKNFTEDCFMLWRSLPSIIVGKHQNTLAETNHDFIKTNNFPVIRRLSGGGTVYHDLGNINFTFITNNHCGGKINFPFFLKPVMEMLHTFDIHVTMNHRNNLFIGDKKISGTAAHMAKNKIIHHGTLLFKSSINDLNNALKSHSKKYSDKSVKSIHSPVTNICDNLKEKMDISELMGLLEKKIKHEFNVKTDYVLQKNDIKTIEYVSETKYKLWSWNYGYSPAYHFNNSVLIDEIKVEIEIHVSKGLIEVIKVSNDISTTHKAQIENAIIGQPHEITYLEKALSVFPISKANKEIFIKSFF